MPRKSATGATEYDARRKVAKAQEALLLAQRNRTQVKLDSEQAMEQARKRAEKRLEKATEEVERRAQELARAEGTLRELQGARVDLPPPVATDPVQADG